MAKKLFIEVSVHNENKLETALSVEFRRRVYGLSIAEMDDKYQLRFQLDGLIGMLYVEIDRIGAQDDGVGHTYQTYYKVSCDNCVWYLTYEDISVIKQFATGVGNTVREMIKRAM